MHHNFLSESEAAHIRKLAAIQLKRSTVVGPNGEPSCILDMTFVRVVFVSSFGSLPLSLCPFSVRQASQVLLLLRKAALPCCLFTLRVLKHVLDCLRAKLCQIAPVQNCACVSPLCLCLTQAPLSWILCGQAMAHSFQDSRCEPDLGRHRFNTKGSTLCMLSRLGLTLGVQLGPSAASSH